MAFLKPTKLKTDNKRRLNYVDSFIDDSKLDKLAHKLIEYGFTNYGHCVMFSKNGIDFIYLGKIFRMAENGEQISVAMRTVNLVNIKRVIKGMADFTLIKS